MKVLIIDDEPKVVQLILHLVDWSGLGMTIVGTAGDGSSALKMIIELEPDIVITDIRIPNPDGIELIQKVQEAQLFPFFIIISGYNDFNYAQKALRLGVEDYLLKPISQKDLEYVLRKIIGKHHEQVRITDSENALTRELEQTRRQVKDKFLSDVLLQKDFSAAGTSLQDMALQYHCDFSGDSFLFLTVHVYTGEPGAGQRPEEEYNFILPRLQNYLKDLFSEICHECVGLSTTEELYMLFNFSGKDQSVFTEKLQENYFNIKTIYPGVNIAIGISSVFSSLSDLPDCFQQSRLALTKRFSNENTVLQVSDEETSKSGSPGIGPENRKKLSEAISLLNCDLFSTAFRKTVQDLHTTVSVGPPLLTCYEELVDLLVFELRNTNTELEIPKEQLLSGFDKIYSFMDLFDWLEEMSRSLIQNILTEKQDREEKPIRLAKQFINEHFSEPITLEAVSAHVGFNPAYLSTVFKKSCGQNFLDYLRDVRISNAKYLLQYTSMPIADVSANIGYTDTKYFTRIFREKTKLSPLEYRKLYGSEDS